MFAIAPAPPIEVPGNLNEAELLRLQRLVVDVYQPSVLEHLSRLTRADLAPWSRSCPWMRSPRCRAALMPWPRALRPHTLPYEVPADHALAQAEAEIVAAELGEDEIRGLSARKMQRNFRTKIGKLAALSLLENTRWGRHRREEIFEAALDDPESCYFFAAAVTPTQAEWNRLIAELVHAPRYLFYALRLFHFPADPDLRSAMAAALADDPLFYFAIDEPRGRVAVKAIETFLKGEIRKPRECLLALVINPEHHQAEEWVDVLSHDPYLSFEAMSLLRYGGRISAQEKFGQQLRAAAFKEARWGAHWVRDLGVIPEEDISQLLPHLDWVGELIEVGACDLKVASIVDDEAAKVMEEKHWLRCSFLLYCAEKANEI